MSGFLCEGAAPSPSALVRLRLHIPELLATPHHACHLRRCCCLPPNAPSCIPLPMTTQLLQRCCDGPFCTFAEGRRRAHAGEASRRSHHQGPSALATAIDLTNDAPNKWRAGHPTVDSGGAGCVGGGVRPHADVDGFPDWSILGETAGAATQIDARSKQPKLLPLHRMLSRTQTDDLAPGVEPW